MAAPSVVRNQIRDIAVTTGISENLPGTINYNGSVNRLRVNKSGSNSTTSGASYFIEIALDATTDFADQAFAICCSLSNSGNTSLLFGLASASGKRLWDLGNPASNTLRTYHIDPTLGAYVDTGSFSLSAVTALRFEWVQGITAAPAIRINDYPYSWLKGIGPSLVGGEVGNTASLSNLQGLSGGFPASTQDATGTERTLASFGNYISLAHSITINAVEIEALNGALFFPDNTSIAAEPWLLTGRPTVNIDASQEINVEIVAETTAKKYDLNATGGGNLLLKLVRSDAIDFDDCDFSGSIRQGQGLCQGGVKVAGLFQGFVADHAYKLTTADIAGSRFAANDGAILIQDAGTYDLSGAVFDGNTTNVTVDGVAATLVLSAAQFAAYNADPANFPIATINSGSATVTGPTVALSAPNVVDPDHDIQAALLRQETFVVADISTAINTTDNTLTLTGNRFTVTSPATFLAFIPQTGTTLPQIDGDPIEPLGLYFVESIDGSNITLAKTEGGSELDFTSAGTGAFVVRAWTEIDSQVVAAASPGYSVTLSEPAGTTLLLKARGHQNDSLPATATRYLIREIAWNAVSQTVPDTLNFTATPDPVYNAITAATEYTNDGESVTGISFDLDGTVQFDFDGPATLPVQDVFAWYVWYTSTEEGIRYVGDVVNALNEANINIAPPIQFENIDSGTVLRLTGAFVRRTDGANLTFIGPTSGVIEYDFDQLAVPYTVPSGSGLSTEQSGQLADLAATLEDPGVFSEAALANAPSGGGSGGGEIDLGLTGFITLMRSDSAYRRLVAEAQGIPSLADELALIRTQVWSSVEVQTAWNAALGTEGITTPSTGEIALWNGYLTATGFDGISFGTGGVVS